MAEDVTLKEYIEKLLDGDRRANDHRFSAQEKAIEIAEHSRDVAIKKAEDSIEKRSDAVYVKVTDLEKSLSAVMLRPEMEARFKAITEKTDDLKTTKDNSAGKSAGLSQGATIFVVGIGLIGTIVGIVGAIIAFTR